MKENTKIQFKKPESNKKSLDKKPCLIMIGGDYLGEIFPLEQATCLIGRDDDVDIVIADTGVSRRHAMIQKNDIQFVLSDLKSTNGTEVNGKSVQENVTLNDGDKITFGNTVLKFCYQDDIDAEYHKKLRNMAIRDGLTRLYNKRYFNDCLIKEFNYSKRHDIALSVLIFDIDHFKRLNDSYGHPAGDYVLKRLSALLEKGIRGYDVFARFGGEEFAFLLRGLSQTAALPFAERIRKLVAEGLFQYEDQNLEVTISVGVATFDTQHPFPDPDALIRAADQSLYEAKRGGRNRVHAA